VIARYSSLFGLVVSNEKKSFITLAPDVFLKNDTKKKNETLQIETSSLTLFILKLSIMKLCRMPLNGMALYNIPTKRIAIRWIKN
jgi:hypothetical protein